MINGSAQTIEGKRHWYDTENDVQMKDYFYQFPFGNCYLADRVHLTRLWSALSFPFLKFWVQHKDMGNISPTGDLLSHFLGTPAPTNKQN